MSQNSIVLPTTGTLTGLQLVQDINNALDTLNTLYSGPAAPTTTEAYMLWADTTNGILKQRNSANSAWVALGLLGAQAWIQAANLVPGAVEGAAVAPFSLRNKIINGAMSIDQRNAGAAQAIPADGGIHYCVDRFFAYCAGAAVTGQQITNSSGQNRYQFTGASGNTSIGFSHRIERLNSRNLAGKTATFQCLLSSTYLTTVTWKAYYAASNDSFGASDVTIATGTFTISSTEALYSVQISIPAAATTGLEIALTTTGLPVSQTLTIGEMQLVEGTVVTPFEHRPIGFELALAQRYYWRLNAVAAVGTFANGYADNATTVYVSGAFPVPMRVSPSFSYGGTFAVVPVITSVTLALNVVNTNQFSLACTGSGFTQGDAKTLIANNNAASYIEFYAEF